MKPTIYLDMDGVCADFTSGMEEAFDLSYDELVEYQYHIHEHLGISKEEFWDVIDAIPDYWANLPPYPWFEDMYQRLTELGDVHFCTTPTLDPRCSKGKIEWIYRHVEEGHRKYFLTPNKHHLAGPRRILIDDSDMNVRAFIEHGGLGILFPQPWNNSQADHGDAVRTVEDVRRLSSHLAAFHA